MMVRSGPITDGADGVPGRAVGAGRAAAAGGGALGAEPNADVCVVAFTAGPSFSGFLLPKFDSIPSSFQSPTRTEMRLIW